MATTGRWPSIGQEFGHAAAFHVLPAGSLHDRLKHRISQTDREGFADCISGAATRNAQAQGLLDASDFREGAAALDIFGDHFLPRDSNGRVVIRPGYGYPLAGTRIRRYTLGYEQGAAACGGLARQLGQ